MAKKHIKSHEKLGISFAEYGALLGTRAMLANKALTYVYVRENDMGEYDYEEKLDENRHKFTMGCILESKGCGTVGCIGGHMGLILGKAHIDDYTADTDNVLNALFYPPHRYNYDKITADYAVKAIDRFMQGHVTDPWNGLLPKRMLRRD